MKNQSNQINQTGLDAKKVKKDNKTKHLELSLIGYLLKPSFLIQDPSYITTTSTTNNSSYLQFNANSIPQTSDEKFDKKFKEKFEAIFKPTENHRDLSIVQTYSSEISQGITKIKNKVEVHKKVDKDLVDVVYDGYDDSFYSECSPYINYVEYFKYSNCYLKYISEEKLTSKVGFLRRIEFSRTDLDIEEVLMMMGFNKDNEEPLKQDMKICKHACHDIYLKLFKIGKIGMFKNIDAFEFFCFFEEEDVDRKEQMMEIFLGLKKEFKEFICFI